MGNLTRLIDFLNQKLSNRFVRNVGWMGAAEVFIRISRLAATVVLARLLTPYDYGLAAVVLTTNEFVSVFTRNGIWDKLVQADEEDLEELCQTAYWLTWLICGSLFAIQCLVALAVGWFYKDSQVIWPICTIALVYLMIPLGAIQAALVQRENRLQVTALANALQVSSDNVLTVILAFLGLGMWAIVLPKVLVAPVWVTVHCIHYKWRWPKKFRLSRAGEIFRFSRSILGIELLQTLRQNIDYLIAGRFLGIEALGVYYFAFNAGLGISLSVINAIDSALFPHLCASRSEPEEFRKTYISSLKNIALLILPVVLLQSCLAPWYVPIVFGQKWIPAIPILILICLSAIPRPFANAASQGLWAIDKPDWDLRWNLAFTVIFSAALLIGANWNILGVAAAVFLAHAVALPLYTLWVTRYLVTKTTNLTGAA
ncbi:lipopolysaccharide biosynthesis protein [Kamptonema formosum]|uniref:lipopolysaccharide biosynthesis protein n=1 Tax=Kamptonema formosum TaxID=331992 RepID=UPI000347C186|nr:lipopolysaccharide biosynthesis protein [Oscillatoria sp. PCC 10802]